MATMKFKGLQEYINQMGTIYSLSSNTIKRTLYTGAGVAYECCLKEIQKIPVDDSPYSNESRKGLRTVQKQALVKSFGIAPFRNDYGYVNTKLGFDGYNSVQTDTWPQGQPNAMIARSAESGTSFMPATHFMTKGTRAAKSPTEAAMKVAFDTEMKKQVK